MNSLSKLTYKVPEVMQILQICRTTLYKLINNGTIKKVPGLGRKVLISREELKRILGITEEDKDRAA